MNTGQAFSLLQKIVKTFNGECCPQYKLAKLEATPLANKGHNKGKMTARFCSFTVIKKVQNKMRAVALMLGWPNIFDKTVLKWKII